MIFFFYDHSFKNFVCSIINAKLTYLFTGSDFCEREAIFDHTVWGALSPHTSWAPIFANQDHAQARRLLRWATPRTWPFAN